MIHKLLKLHPILPILCLSYVYIVSGIFVNFLQLLIYIFIRTISEHWGTKLNGYVQASHMAIFTFVCDWHCECNIRFYYDTDSLKPVNTEHVMCICNHWGEVDWLLGYMLLERIDGLKGCKGVIKKESKYLPVVGWQMWFTDYLFLSRNWTQDQQIISKTCKKWARNHPSQNSNFYILMAEGTRFTHAKHEASIQFCKERGYEPFRNVLYPRTKGAAEMMTQLGDSLGAVYNVIFAFPGDVKPDTKTMFAGKSTDIDIYFRRIPTTEVPESKDEKNKFIVDMFRDKDALLDYHKEHKAFPGEEQALPRKRRSLVMLYVWSVVSAVPGAYVLHLILARGSLTTLGVLVALLVVGGLCAYRIVSAAVMTKVSNYGTAKYQADIDNKGNKEYKGACLL